MKHIIKNTGFELWQNNKLIHREDGGPAIIWGDGSEEWHINDYLKREDGNPAYIKASGDRWFENKVFKQYETSNLF